MNAITFKSSVLAPELIPQTIKAAAKAPRLVVLPLAVLSRRLLDTLYAWQRRSIEREQLLDMSDRLLADIGIDRVEARREAAKPFWKP